MKGDIKLALPEDVALKQPLVLYDGSCTLCSSSMRFLLRHNRSESLRFMPLQSQTASEFLSMAGKPVQKADTVIFIQDNQLYSHSTAALKIAAHLDFPLNLLKYFFVVPRVVRDFVYRLIAENRYKWFGREPSCPAGYQLYQKRFLS